MDVIVDGERNFEVTGTPKDVFAVVGAVSDFLRERGRAILSLNLDGADITPESLAESLEGKTLEAHQRLEVSSGLIATMVGACLDELQKCLPELPKACRGLAEVFHGESPEEGFAPFEELAGLWETVKKRELLVIHALGLAGEEFQVGDVTMGDMHAELNRHLEEAAQALRDNDCILLGDLLEYELAPRAERELDIVALLRKSVATHSGA